MQHFTGSEESRNVAPASYLKHQQQLQSQYQGLLLFLETVFFNKVHLDLFRFISSTLIQIKKLNF